MKKKILLIGNPLSHSLSPIMHNAVLKSWDLDIRYFTKETTDLKKTITQLRKDQYIGANVTIPFKEQVIKHLDKIDPIAKKIGAVNTIVKKDKKLIGYNTDWIGFNDALEQICPIKNKKVVILGAGGAARAVCFALKKNDADILILNRTISKAKSLAEEFNCRAGSINDIEDADILVNSTPIGMYPLIDNSPIKKNELKHFKIIFDLIYNPLKTRLLSYAKSIGLTTANGIDMLVFQGAHSIKLWLDKEPDTSSMKKTLIEYLR